MNVNISRIILNRISFACPHSVPVLIIIIIISSGEYTTMNVVFNLIGKGKNVGDTDQNQTSLDPL